GAQVDLELVIEGEIGQAQEGPAVDEVDDVDTAEVLLDVEDPAAGDAGGVGEQRVIDPAVRHHHNRLPVLLAEHRVDETNAALLHLAETLPLQVRLVPGRGGAFKESFYLPEHLGCAL